ncbi:hypothetical protein [Collimonas fungivorans]|uniref:hypothetical protein n=1 Tax=Collimonas fungivorans TaxID=158899 RepID=UPI0026EC198E|nr:hypothetical protein [Collimonas fungivorans]
MQALSQIFKNLMHIVCAETAAGDAHHPKSIAKNHALGADLLPSPSMHRAHFMLITHIVIRKSKKDAGCARGCNNRDAHFASAASPPPGNAPYFETGASGLPTNNGEKVCVLHIG